MAWPRLVPRGWAGRTMLQGNMLVRRGSMVVLSRQVRNTASGLMQGTTDTVSNLAHGAKEQALRAGRTFERLLHENPLAVGAAAVAVGAAVGLALPSTRIEQEYMGELSENVVDKTKQVAREAMDKVKTAAQPEQPKPPQPGTSKSTESAPSTRSARTTKTYSINTDWSVG